MILRPALPEEAPLLTALAHDAKRHWGYPEEWIARWRSALTVTPATFLESRVTVAQRADGIAGFTALTIRGTLATLDHLWVEPTRLRQGVGRRLFTDAAAFAGRAGVLRLQATADPHAEDFYRRMGMVTVGHEPAAMDHRPRALPVLEMDLHRRGPQPAE